MEYKTIIGLLLIVPLAIYIFSRRLNVYEKPQHKAFVEALENAKNSEDGELTQEEKDSIQYGTMVWPLFYIFFWYSRLVKTKPIKAKSIIKYKISLIVAIIKVCLIYLPIVYILFIGNFFEPEISLLLFFAVLGLTLYFIWPSKKNKPPQG